MMEGSPFHTVGHLFSGETSVEFVSPDTPVIDALGIMLVKRYSQIPVIDNGAVRGLFSLWSLAHHLTIAPAVKVRDLLVEDVVEQAPLVTVTDTLHSVLSRLERHGALLVDSPHGLQAIATAFDVYRYFYRVARPFIHIQEIEIGLRRLIGRCAPGGKLKECIDRVLPKAFESRGLRLPVPTELHEMSFDDYRSIICSKENWSLFEGVLGPNRKLVSAKLGRIGKIRNKVFHFRPDISELEYETLANARRWLLDKTRWAERVRKEGEDVQRS